MKLSQQIAIPGVITILCLLLLSAFSLFSYYRYNSLLAQASERLEAISRLTSQLDNLHDKRTQYLLVNQYLPQRDLYYNLDELEQRSTDITDELASQLRDSPRGQYLLRAFLRSRVGMIPLQNRLLTAIRQHNQQKIADLFSQWSLRESYSQAYLKDIVGFSSVNQATAMIVIRRLTERGVIIFSTILALALATILISQTYFRAHLVIPLTQLANYLKHVGEGVFHERAIVNSGDEIGELAMSFNAMVRRLGATTNQLRDSNRNLESFTSIAAHDLRSPLCTIRDLTMMMREELAERISAEYQDMMQRISGIAERAIHLIDSLLTLARSSQKPLHMERTDLHGLIREVVSSLQSQIDKTAGIVEVQNCPTVIGDPIQLGELFQNLISNALKYHKPGIPPVVKIWSNGSENSDFHQIYVRDNGIGFNVQEREAIFNAFHRTTEAHSYEGSGVGLAICKEIASRHGGSINADSVPGLGSTFIVLLPKKYSGESNHLVSG